MCKKSNRSKSASVSGPFKIFLSMGYRNIYARAIFRERFYINDFQTAEEAINFANRLSDFIIANAENGFPCGCLWVTRPLGIIPPIPTELMTKAKENALKLDTTSIEAFDNFKTLLNEAIQRFGISLGSIEKFRSLILAKQ